MNTFAARGYNNASLQEIAVQAGVIQAGVLHYFRSKAPLLTSVLDLRDASDIEQLGLDAEEPGRAEAELRAIEDTIESLRQSGPPAQARAQTAVNPSGKRRKRHQPKPRLRGRQGRQGAAGRRRHR